MPGSGSATRRALAIAGAVLMLGQLMLPLHALRAQGVATSLEKPETGVGSAFELVFWQSVADSNDPAQYEAYLLKYPNGTFSKLAKAKLASLQRATGGSPAPPLPAPPPAPQFSAGAPAVPSPVGAVATPPPQSFATPAPAAPTDPLAAALLPHRPQLAVVPGIDLPASFCSIRERIDFHQGDYLAAKQTADENNDAAIAHLDKLKQLNQQLASMGRIDQANMVAREAQAYRALADQTYQKSASFGPLYEKLMTVPIRTCGQAAGS